MGSVQSAGHRLQNSKTLYDNGPGSMNDSNAVSFRKRSMSFQDKVNPNDSQQHYFIPPPTLDRKHTNLTDQTLGNGPDSTPQSHLMDMDMQSRDFIPFSERCQNSDTKTTECIDKKSGESTHRIIKSLSLKLNTKGSRARRTGAADKDVCSIMEDPPFEEAYSEGDEHPRTLGYTNENTEEFFDVADDENNARLTPNSQKGREETRALVSKITDLEGLNDENELARRVMKVIFSKSKKFGLFAYGATTRIDSNLEKLPPYHDPITQAIYYGTWKDSKRHGKGCIIWPDGSIYQGLWDNDMRCGKGRYITATGNVYEGEWKNDKLDGKGKCVYASGAIYDGEWAGDRKHGFGREVYADKKTTYEGSFENNIKKGRGRQQWADGSVYSGDFADNIMNGYGILEWADGRKYKGDWKNDKMHGKGEFSWPDGRKFVGEYSNDKKQGYGEFEWADKNTYKGPFVNNKMHGQGLYLSACGKSRQGIWQEGKIMKWI